MTIYFMEKKEDGTTSLFNGEMNDRAKLWVAHPNAKEISKKQYFALIEFFNSKEYISSTLLKTNK